MITRLILLCLAARGTNPPERPLRIGDRIKILAYGTGLGGEYVVLTDGTIDGRGITRLPVRGRTMAQVQTDVEAIFAKRLRKVMVEVSAISLLSDTVNVSIGDLSAPRAIVPGTDLRTLLSSVPIKGDPDLLEAIYYPTAGQAKPISIPRLLRGEPSEWNGEVQDKDTLVILPRRTVDVWFTGPFARTGEVRLPAGIDVYRAISQVGDPTSRYQAIEEASVIVSRGPERYVFPLQPDPTKPEFAIHDGDVLTLAPPKTVKVVVAGDVNAPGEYTLNAASSLDGAVAMAKGPTPVATLRNVLVYRNGEMLEVDLTRAARGQGLAAPGIEQGDTIFVRRNERTVVVIGRVATPTKIPMPDGETLRVTDALARAGGINERGTPRRVTILRPAEGGRISRLVFNLDDFMKNGTTSANPELQPGDVLVFGDAKGNILAQAFQAVSGLLLVRSIAR